VSPVKISPNELRVYSRWLHNVSGIVIDDSKAYLLESRLGPILKAHDLQNFTQLMNMLCAPGRHTLQDMVIDAMTTNETSFFRDRTPFDLIKFKLVPDHYERAGSPDRWPSFPLNIWSAACATGQEIYSVIITLVEILGNLTRYNIRILGTDLSDQSIARASLGRYSAFEINRGMPPDKLAKFFLPDGGDYRIRDEFRSIVTVKKMNLLKPFTLPKKYDIILCRNVAIYFSPVNRRLLFDRLGDCLNPGGVLLIGSTESLTGVTNRFVRNEFRRGIYYTLAS